MQLVAYGAQDVYLTGNPQITFFKVVYRRHTNFSMENVEQTINGNIAWGSTLQVVTSRSGDLLHKVSLEYTRPSISSGSVSRIPHNFGHYIIDNISLTIGGSEIDKIYGHWMEIYSRLTQPNNAKQLGIYTNEMINTSANPSPNNGENSGKPQYDSFETYDVMFNNIPQCNNYQQLTGACGVTGKIMNTTSSVTEGENTIPKKLIIPIPFWFCRNPGNSLPLIALQYHEVKFTIKLKDNYSLKFFDSNNVYATEDAFNSNLFGTSGNNNTGLKLFCEYIYLDTNERRRFAQVSHEYLIEQVQYQQANNIN